MGTITILDILNEDKRKLKNVNRIIISSNNKYCLLRSNIIDLGYYINNEKIVFEDNKFYIVIEFVKGKKKYDYKDLYFGPILLKNKNELFYEYYNKIYDKKKNILKQKYDKKLEEEINMIKKEI